MLNTERVIVAGVTSSGKSTFIANQLIPTFEASGTPVRSIFAYELIRKFNLWGDRIGPVPPFELPTGAVNILHVNLLMPVEVERGFHDLAVEERPLFRALTGYAADYDVYLCYAPDPVIQARIAARSEIEPHLAAPGTLPPYPADRFQESFARIGQRQLLLSFGRAIAPFARSRTIVYSNAHKTSRLSWDEFKHGLPSARLEEALV